MGKRSDGQVNISTWVDSKLRSAIEEGRLKCRQDISQFLRDAIKEKLESVGLKVPEELIAPPSRSKFSAVALNEGTGHSQITVAQSGKKNMSYHGVPEGKKVRTVKQKKL